MGSACLGCKKNKYGCDQTGDMEAKTMKVTRPALDSESDVPDRKKKGKKRRAKLPEERKKRKTKVKELKVKETKTKELTVKVEKAVKVKSEKATAASKASGSKAGKAAKGSPMETESSDGLGKTTSDDEPKKKRARRTHGKPSDSFIVGSC